jgi:hypothetical protein
MTDDSNKQQQPEASASCEDDGDDDDNSLAAVASEDYGDFVDETGRSVCPGDDYTIQRHATAPVTGTSHSDFLVVPPRATDGLDFDMDEPWQRSMKKQLDKMDDYDTEDEKQKRKPNTVLLGHTESRDFGLEVDKDDMSLGTSISSTIPTKGQYIHRAFLNQPVLSEDETYNNDQITFKKKGNGSETSSLTGNSEFPMEREERNPISPVRRENRRKKMMPKKRQNGYPGITRQHQSPPYLEMESQQDEIGTVMEPNDPACFCLGYNVWDYVLPPPSQPPSSPARRRFSRRSSRLNRVDEEDAREVVDVHMMGCDEEIAMPAPAPVAHHKREPSGNYAGYV